MASTTVDPPHPPPPPSSRLSLESLPAIDLRLLSQSELTALSLCSPRAFDLRRCNDVVIPKIDRSIFNESAGSRKQTYSRLRLAPRKPDLSTSKPSFRVPPPLDSDRAENSRIVQLFKSLFLNPNFTHTPEKCVPSGNSVVVYNPNLRVQEESSGFKRKRGRKRKDKDKEERPLGDRDRNAVVVYERGRDEGVNQEVEKGLVNKNGVLVDLGELEKMEDPYGQELRRRTQGKTKPEELLEFINQLDGQWGSRRKKRKVVDANQFGHVLPNGWKILIAMKKRAGYAWVFCRRYVSPTGRYFASCKEVSSYLLSLTSPQGSRQQSDVQCAEDSTLENKAASAKVEVRTISDAPSLYAASQPNDREDQQNQIHTPQPIDQGKQLIVYNNVQPGEVKAVSGLLCHKCSTPFSEKDGLLNHLISCHKRKRLKRGEPTELLMKTGRYECQFCDRIFFERTTYFGHVGIHVKNYMKNIGGSPSVTLTPEQKTSDLVSIGGASVTVSGTSVSAEVNVESVSGTPNIHASSEPSLNDRKPKLDSDGETNSGNCDPDQINNISLHSQLNTDAAQRDASPVDESSDKQDVSDTEVGKVDDENNDVSGVNPDPVGKVFNDENNDVCQHHADEINPNECVPSDSSQLNKETDGRFIDGSALESKGVVSENGSLTSKDFADGSDDNKNVDNNSPDEGLTSGNDDELIAEPDGAHLNNVVDGANTAQHTGNLDELSGAPHEEEKMSDISAVKTDYDGSILADSKVERNSETCSPSGDQCIVGVQNYDKDVFNGLVDETEEVLCSLGNAQVTVDGKHFIDDEERQTESTVLFLSKNDDGNYIQDDLVEKAPALTLMELQGSQASQAEEAFSPRSGHSNRVDEGPKSDAVTYSGTLFFTSGVTDMSLDANVMINSEQQKVSEGCSQIGAGSSKSDISDALGAYNSFVDNKQDLNSKNLSSGLSVNEPMHEVAIDNVASGSTGAATMELPEVTKDENLRDDNKLILDFGSMTEEINARFSTSVEHQQTVPGSSSPFSLWGEEICLEDNQTNRAYGGSRGMEQGRASDNSSLNLVGLQQSCDGGYNLNKVGMNEQRYNVQHNEFYNRSNEGGERISLGNQLNSAGLQRQCDVGYNLNRPCPNQPSFGIQHNQAGAYTTSDQARQERVAYGNSLSLASVQPTCDTGYSLNKGYLGSVQGLSKSDGLEHSRDRQHLMAGFGGNSGSRTNQGVPTDFMWRTNQGNIQSGGLVDSSSTHGQPSGSFQAFDFLSDKGGNGLYAGNDKFDMSSFGGLRSAPVEPMEFSFLTTHDSNAQLEDPKVLSYHGGGMDQGFGSPAWNQKANPLPNMMGPPQVVTTMCVWCGNEFHQDSLSCEIQAGSIGFLCPTCKGRAF